MPERTNTSITVSKEIIEAAEKAFKERYGSIDNRQIIVEYLLERETLKMKMDQLKGKYKLKDVINGNSAQTKKIRELLKQGGYKDSDLDNESGWFTYLGAIAAIKNVAPAVLEYYGRS